MTDNALTRDEIARTIRDEVSREVKKGVIEIYEDLLINIWDRILPTLGSLTVATITSKAVSKAKLKYPIIEQLAVAEDGVSFAALRETSAIDEHDLRDALKEVVSNLFDILAKLTGNILVTQLMREIEGLDVDPEA